MKALSDRRIDTTNWRICTTARFDTPAGDVTVMATHWDHQSNPARAQAASLILHRAKSIVEQTGRPVLLFGDMNSPTCELCLRFHMILLICWFKLVKIQPDTRSSQANKHQKKSTLPLLRSTLSSPTSHSASKT